MHSTGAAGSPTTLYCLMMSRDSSSLGMNTLLALGTVFSANRLTCVHVAPESGHALADGRPSLLICTPPS